MPPPVESPNHAPERHARLLLERAQAIAHVGSWYYEATDGRFTLSDEMCRLNGMPPGARPTLEEFVAPVHPGDRERVVADARAAVVAGEACDLEFRLRVDGRTRWVRLQIPRADGSLRQYPGDTLGVLQDIHASRVTELALAALHEHLGEGDYFEHLLLRLCELLEVEMAVIAVREGAETRAMRDVAMVIDGEPQPLQRFELDEEGMRLMAAGQPIIHARAVRQVFPHNRTLARVRAEGYAATPLCDTGGAGFGLLAIIARHALHEHALILRLLKLFAQRIASEIRRREQEERLRASEARYRRLVENVRTEYFFFRHDANYNCTYVSPSAATILGFPLERIVHTLSKLQQARLAATAQDSQRYIDNIRAGNTQSLVQFEFPRADGSPCVLEVSAVPVHDAQGRLLGGEGLAHDITRRRIAERALEELNGQLEQRITERTRELQESNTRLEAREAEMYAATIAAEAASRAKSAFLATMSHEIRTPLNGMIGMVDVLEHGGLDPSQRALVETVRESGFALLAIIDDVLDFSKIEAGRMDLESRPLALHELLDGLLSTLRALALPRSVVVRLDLDPQLPRHVVGDATRIRQVLLNIGGNAVKFSGAGNGVVTISVRLGACDDVRALLVFTITDNGIGMDEATLAALFRPFTQADAATTRRFGGTGLGLSIAHRLVQLMGGDIRVASRLGAGSSFELRLPLGVAHAPLPEPAVVSPALTGSAAWSEARILVAEDNEINQRVILQQLKLLGLGADVADNGTRAGTVERWRLRHRSQRSAHAGDGRLRAVPGDPCRRARRRTGTVRRDHGQRDQGRGRALSRARHGRLPHQAGADGAPARHARALAAACPGGQRSEHGTCRRRLPA
ncbi:MAG: Sensor histidine kinase RcsC [Pseudomonadales bacterium]|nr:Sensor histidine kinase RcsC [Pseudomonadales bacterium]